MFERYTEKARRVVFFARYEASKFGSPYIETEHLLLGILRENKGIINKLPPRSAESIRKEIEGKVIRGEEFPTSVDLPLSNESKRVLAYAAEEAERLGHKHIGTEHLFLGLLREENSLAAALLRERGVRLEAMRKEMESMAAPQPEGGTAISMGSRAVSESSPVNDFARDLTQVAREGRLDPLVGREKELDAILGVVCRSFRRSAMLIGERGAGKSSIVEGLAQSIAGGLAPQPLLDQRVLAMDGETIARWALSGHYADERLNQTVKAMIEASNTIFYISDLMQLISVGANSRTAVILGILKHWLLRGKLTCIAACTPGEYKPMALSAPWIRECFSEIHVQTLDETATRQVLDARKHPYEAFHGVTYAEDALDLAAHSTARYLPHKSLPGKALELLDAAGVRVRSRRGALPPEIAESLKRLNFIRGRMETAEKNHEFEKARFYSEEQEKEKQNLKAMEAKREISDPISATTVTRQDVESVIAQWSEYPFQP